MVRFFTDSKPQFENLFLPRGQGRQNLPGLVLQIHIDDRLGGCHRTPVFDEISEMAVLLIPDRGLERDRLTRDLEDLARIIREQKLTPMADARYAIDFGKFIPAELILVGRMVKGRNYVTLIGRLCDVERRRFVCWEEAYGESDDDSALLMCAKALAEKIERRFPLVRGTVESREGRRLRLGLGSSSGLRLGTKVLVYRSTWSGKQEALDPVTYGDDRRVEARITDVQPSRAVAEVSTSEEAEQVRPKDVVITK